MARKGLIRSFIFMAIMALAGCSGSGGGGIAGGGGVGGGVGAGSSSLPSPDPLADAQPATDFSGDPEFDPCYIGGGNIYCVYGLGQIGAQYAYAEGAYGGGVVVAVIDTGIDMDHFELDANISSDSIDIVTGDPLIDENGHGTHVAGIIAAERNGSNLHGVAFEATILAIRTDTLIEDEDICGGPDPCTIFTSDDIAAALDYAAGRAHVINLSLGASGTLGPEVEQALIDAMDADAIIVAAAGNDSASQPRWPAAYASDTTINASGQLIAVGAVDSSNNLAGFSNECGDAMDYCLVAPGVAIVSTYTGGGFGVVSGTSQAAPHVAGAAALLIQRWPALSPDEVVEILLTTAEDLGAAGVDTVYGHGLLDLQAAVSPLGEPVVPLGDSASGESADLSQTLLSLGSAFGDALANSPLLGAAIVLDDYDRDFAVDLAVNVVSASRDFGLNALIRDDDIETLDAAPADGVTVTMRVSAPDTTERLSTWTPGAGDPGPVLSALSLSAETAGGGEVQIGYNVSVEYQLPGVASVPDAGLFWMAGDTLGPHHALVGTGSGFSLTQPLGGATAVSLGWVDETRNENGDTGAARIGELSVVHRFQGGAMLRAGLAAIDETGGFLGSEAAGGFALEGASSRVYTMGGTMPLGGGFALLGNYAVLEASMAAGGAGLLDDWSTVRADAFGFGVVRRGVFGAADRIGLLAGQPLRVYEAQATLTVPVDYGPDKSVVQESGRVSLVPTGRELDIQLAYDTPVSSAARLSGWLMMQLEPGHVADAGPAYAIGMRFRASF